MPYTEEKRKAYRAAKYAAGLCKFCLEPRQKDRKTCRRHGLIDARRKRRARTKEPA